VGDGSTIEKATSAQRVVAREKGREHLTVQPDVSQIVAYFFYGVTPCPYPLFIVPSMDTIARHATVYRRRAATAFTFHCKDLIDDLGKWYHPHDFWSSPRIRKNLTRIESIIEMATTKKRTTTTTTPTREEWKGFLECPLTDAQITQCDEWKPKPTELWEGYDALTRSGVEVKTSYSSVLSAATCTLADQRPNSPTRGYAISARDTTAALAFKMALFKFHFVLEENLTPLLSQAPKSKRG